MIATSLSYPVDMFSITVHISVCAAAWHCIKVGGAATVYRPIRIILVGPQRVGAALRVRRQY